MNTQPDALTYHALEQLQAMTLSEIEALWELVPTERQRLYRAIYDRTRRDEGASGSDALEARMVEQLLERYGERALVPVGSYWVPTPKQIQTAAIADVDYVPADPIDALPKGKRPSSAILVAGIACIALLGFLLLRNINSKVGSANGTATRTITATLARTYTPTPLALEDQDAIIRGGSTGGSTAVYPVNLRVSISDEAQPRIFVVQRRVVNTAEWVYDDNPDVASYINGLAVRAVLGIPWSEPNADLFNHVVQGSTFVLQMNTGTALRFTCTEKTRINRGDTSVFSQTKPGLVLVLMGEHNPEITEPSAERLVLLADYTPGQDMALFSAPLPTIAAPTPTPMPTLAERMDVQVVSATTQPGRLTVRLRVFNGRFSPLALDNSSVWLIYGYSERPSGPRISAELTTIWLEPGQAADLTLTFAWQGEPFATLGLFEEYSYSLTLR